MNPTDDDFWGPVISSYSRAQAIEDGVLVALDPKLCLEAGIRHPGAVTAAVHARCIALTPAAEPAGNDLVGRTWDVLATLLHAIRASKGPGSVVAFQALAVTGRMRPTLHRLKAVCGPGDDAEPVITVMLQDED